MNDIPKTNTENLEQLRANMREKAAINEAHLNEQITQAHIALRQACTSVGELTDQNRNLTKALVSAMNLIDELLTELGKLCSVTQTPPPMSIFSAKRNLDIAVRAVLTPNLTPDLPPNNPPGSQ